ncbi:hypothetical protein [Brackiella oedipodis]|uniref:hypothetical protein n=1 Tax=Brackiella oedipodis TaxID=124225 RepID=UPI0012EBAB2C|nr:hypothetical protein [Brackiella oedipodis]
MKKFALLVSTAVLALSSVAAHAEPDYRSKWAKSQDMYVEPTLKMTTTNVAVTPEQAAQAQQYGVTVNQVAAGAAGTTQTTVYGPNGEVVQQAGNAVQSAPVPAAVPGQVEPTPDGFRQKRVNPAQGAGVAQPTQKIQDYSRTAP